MTCLSQPAATATLDEVLALFALPFNDLLDRAHTVHRRHADPNEVQLSTLLSIRTGACVEDCKYCSQSKHHDTGLKASKMVGLEEVEAAAATAKAAGAGRLCLGSAGRGPNGRDLERVVAMVRVIKDAGLESCVTLGMLDEGQALALKDAGLDYYNHNLDTSEEYYPNIVSTHTFQDRLGTLGAVRRAGLKVCCGGIIGMGEGRGDRAALLLALAQLDPPPESVPINLLVPIAGSPLGDQAPLDVFELVRTIAVARLLMPTSRLRLSAGRRSLSDEAHALCFFAGANSIFYGDTLLTTTNADADRDRGLMDRLGLHTRNA